AGRPWPEVVAVHQALLTDPDLRAAYFAVADPVTIYGLPMAPVQDMGNVLVLRAQRGILQKWLVDVPWARAGQVTIANSGDVAKEAGLLPTAALRLQNGSELARSGGAPLLPSPSTPPVAGSPPPSTPSPTASPVPWANNPAAVTPQPLNLPPLRMAPARADRRPWRVVLDPGHGGAEIGAAHTFDNGSIIAEKNINLRIALHAAQLLRGAGIEVTLTRDTDRQVNAPPADRNGDGQASLSDDLQARADIANQVNADVFVSVHNNGHSNPRLAGTEVYFNESRPFADRNRALAGFLDRRIVEMIRLAGYTQAPDRGIRTDASVTRGRHFAVLGPQTSQIPRPSGMPGVLTESLFVSSDFDAPWLARPEIQDAIARGHAEGILDFLEWLGRGG
ncbi:MAG TPA: N-acetylmuramoyl-L-alanine amidase, partial [Dehalococcoidia bacterium]|nr:N-acetylmuramoyl-L-alanine amidase [Dehalococcoidia bacterium]